MGRGTAATSDVPKRIESLKGTKIIRIACGSFHCAAVTDKGRVYTWGQATAGQLGHGTTPTDVNEPKIVEALRKSNVLSVACGDSHTCFLCGM